MQEELETRDDPKDKEMKLVTDKELLARFYGKEADLDEDEKFLRNYILNEGWKDRGQKIKMPKTDREKPLVKGKDDAVDVEDDKREDEMDQFETKYNFRFEEPNAATITSHAREAFDDETLRRKDDTRKQARERAKERKEDMKRKQKEEIAKLKELKREEILEKLEKTNKFSKGNLFEDKQLVERIQKELETEFIPDLYDKTMTKMFGDKYYEAEEIEDEADIEAERGIDLKLLQDRDLSDKGSDMEGKSSSK